MLRSLLVPALAASIGFLLLLGAFGGPSGYVDRGRRDLLEYDHVPAYELTGHTIVEELRLRCAPCHHRRQATENREAARI